jgi:hypothetical protein
MSIWAALSISWRVPATATLPEVVWRAVPGGL